MTSSISWIDRTDLAETLARFGPTASRLAHKPSAMVGVSRLEPTLDTRPSLEPFEPPPGPLRERLEAFIDWMMRHSGSHVAFVIDHDGLPLVDRGADADLMAVASSVMQLVGRINRKLLALVGQSVTLQLEQGLLVLISATTPIGEYTVGHVGDRAPDPAMQQATAEALRAAFSSDLESST